MEPSSQKRDQAADQPAADADVWLEAALLGADGALVSGIVMEVSGTGVDLYFVIQRAPALSIGEHADIVFRSPWLARPMEVPSNVVSRKAVEQGRRYSFRFERELDLDTPELHKLFDGRGAIRVRPRDDESVEVRIRDPRSGDARALATALCLDISVTGIRLDADASVERELNDVQSVEVYFALPGIDRVLTLGPRIVSRKPKGDRLEYGLFFDQRATYDFVVSQEVVAAYVARRVREGSGVAPTVSGARRATP